MNTDIPRTITADEIETYHRDGVVLLPGMFDEGWIDLLKQGLIANYNEPTERSRVWDRDAAGRTMFYDSQAWQRIAEYRQFIFDFPTARIAKRASTRSISPAWPNRLFPTLTQTRSFSGS